MEEEAETRERKERMGGEKMGGGAKKMKNGEQNLTSFPGLPPRLHPLHGCEIKSKIWLSL